MIDYSKVFKPYTTGTITHDKRKTSNILLQFDMPVYDEFYFIDILIIYVYASNEKNKYFVFFSIKTPKKIIDGKYSDNKYIVSAMFISDNNMIDTIQNYLLNPSHDIVGTDDLKNIVADQKLVFKDNSLIKKVFDKVRGTEHYKKFKKAIEYISTFAKKYNDKSSIEYLNDISILDSDVSDPHFLHYLLFEADPEDGGLKDLKEGDILVRILKLENEGSLKKKNNHWTDKPELLLDTGFLNSIDYNSTEVSTDGYDSFVLITTLNYNDLSLLDTIIARNNYVLESEVTLHGGSSNDIYVCRYKNFNENDPMNSKGIKKLK